MTRLEWLKWRKGGIGGSDAPIVMGVSPWKTPIGLYEEKISETVNEDAGNYATQRGNEVEPKVRALFEVLHGDSFPAALVQSADYPWLLSSLDGRSECKTKICEIKLSGKDDWEAAKNEKKVPEKYWPQLQHNLMVSGAKVCYYLSYKFSREIENSVKSENLAIIEVFPDLAYQKKLFDKEFEFWHEYVLKKVSPPATERDYEPLVGISDLAKSWKKVSEEIAALEERQEKLRKMILDAAEKTGHNRLLCAGIKISKQVRAGSVDYAKVPELQGVDLEPYRKKGSVFWKMDILKEEK